MSSWPPDRSPSLRVLGSARREWERQVASFRIEQVVDALFALPAPARRGVPVRTRRGIVHVIPAVFVLDRWFEVVGRKDASGRWLELGAVRELRGR
jgi:hypothetical protein